ncbi:MAG: NADPH-dependent assimilatory sulfite reductase hemoprotein subunit [Flavisolibacter sp.]|nr:NADPH-dependent assimilatory sulfite reductase hemoprotein subunit [Flavisolibacter sp.]MBD0296289.1 NADPH-dependent assimilatory sulfite reductase hemoprotein subunit [Flavisolibacter sp.]MBD0350452.1 NADPH-dependent assimilatory sulfite reductase hemoprotein subunit [Flavisolibacter sp.]MBD0374220.1 NADPH-dependent assimilatory sulfite reductase hemoprotein subunit [Flavisolibacter sp.]
MNNTDPKISSDSGVPADLGHGPLSSTERIKMASDSLRGTLVESMNNEITGSLNEDDVALVRFHGMYVQDDRDRREERAAKKLERLYSFMIRLRLTGGFLKPEQWVALHHIAGENSTGVLKITTRQTIQLHGVLKSKVKPTLKAFNEIGLTTIATCGDINRNVLCTSHPKESPLHAEVFQITKEVAKLLLPKTHAYYEIWLDHEKLVEKELEQDPLYQNRYMPRKFKIGIAIPPNNDVDVLTNDLGLIAIIEKGKLKGFNIAVGGGMSTTHGNPDHYARLASVLGYVDKENVLKAIYEVLTIQRDYGNRSDRKLARVKYTIDRLGVDWWRAELERRCGFKLEKEKPFEFTQRKDRYGWEKNHEGLWYYTVFVENGRVLDDEKVPLKSALLEVAQTGKATFIFTCNQNVILGDIKKEDKKVIQEILERYGIIEHTEKASGVRKNSIACVALNTCPLALAEAQRYMPHLLDKIEDLLAKHDLNNEEIVIRMTGCPNGCARPFAAEIGFVGTAYGRYNLQIGGDRLGFRLNKIYKENLDEPAILSELDYLFALFKKERKNGEHFGDFAERKQLVAEAVA